MELGTLKETYASILQRFVQRGEEKDLAAAARLGRCLVEADVPPEEIAEIHQHGIRSLAERRPDVVSLHWAERLSAPLMEMLMAYGLVFRRWLEERDQAQQQLKKAYATLERRVRKRTAQLARANKQLQREVQERKAVERMLRIKEFAISSSISATAMADLEGKITYANRAFLALWRYDDPRAVVGRPLAACWADRGEAVRFRDALDRHGGWTGHMVAKRRDGSLFEAHVSGSLVRDDRDVPQCVMACFLDISEQRRAERLAQETERLAAIGHMAARVAHEINNPLAGVMNCFRLIKEAVPKDHRHYQFAGLIEKELLRIAGIVRQMGDLYRPAQHVTRPTAVAQTIREVVAILEPFCREREVRVEVDLDAPHLCLPVPEPSLRQVLYNLLINAVEASPPGKTVKIGAFSAENRVGISVSDCGGGIPEEVQPRLFEPFFTTKANGASGGLGLGLPTCKNIVESLGGTLDFRTQAGRGTVFRIVFPSPSDQKG
ncbi:MAG TPA: PAS domain-containing protein [Planctomycetaceae bacterium]|nr:PAS domain-containing protein [Planctomycetaceae bacterium]